MKKTITLLVAAVSIAAFFWKYPINQTDEKEAPRTSGAGHALTQWSFERAYPNENIPMDRFISAFETHKSMPAFSDRRSLGEWESLGPENIGGRTLCLAFHPTNEDIIFAGSASGGLWRTTTQGVGRFAWEPVPTGFPVLGVAAIAIDPDDPNTMLIGTGETYAVGYAEPGTVNRLTRGSYGIGILKTTDGGDSWSHVLPFSQDDIKGVQDLEINPNNSLEVFAATTDGVYRSLDGGENWSLVFAQSNAIDLEIDPDNGDVLYVSTGNLNFDFDPAINGIFKSVDKGDSFIELTHPNLPAAWSGNAKLSIDPSNSNVIYATIQDWFVSDPEVPAGLLRSTDGGDSWLQINNQNIAQWQGWYSHDIAINPQANNEILYVGIQAWKSTDGGGLFDPYSINSWTMGEVPVDFPEGADNYVHSDIHGVYYHPLNNKVFYATDGGVFVSDDGEVPFTTLNGGLQTTQFYADMGSSATDPNFCISGAQDNASYVYRGNPSWYRVIGGDGMNAAVNQEDDNIVLGSSQRLNIRRSINNGFNYATVSPGLVSGDAAAFSAPFELAPSDQNIAYAAATYLYKATDGIASASSWSPISNGPVDVNPIVKIAIAPEDPDLVYVTTSPDPSNGPSGAKILRSNDGGVNFTEVTNGLPNRICKDIEFDPIDSSILYAVFSGFGTPHVYKTIDGGANWNPIDNGIPDVPGNTILIDPLNPDDIYFGNDLGVYYSEDGGASWESWNENLPEAVMIYDLDQSPSNRKVRVATHGRGIYQRDFVNDFLSIEDQKPLSARISLYPNPASNVLHLDLNMELTGALELSVVDLQGRQIYKLNSSDPNAGLRQQQLDVSLWRSGLYFVRVSANGQEATKRFLKL